MQSEDDIEPDVAIYDDAAVVDLEPFYDARPARSAWRGDAQNAPLGKPVYARAPDTIRVLIALRDEEGWVVIRRDGEMRVIEAIASWAPLASAVG